MNTLIGIYFFIFIGFISKKIFKTIDENTLILLSIYFLQPFLTLWGIMLTPIDYNLFLSPIIYIITIIIALIFTTLLSKLLKDQKEKTIASITPLIGNTGNLGIPLSYALFGDTGASIATILNLANVFFIYTIGIYVFAKNDFNTKEAIIKIIKIPIIWFGIIALFLNYNNIKFDNEIMKILQMGAYTSIVIQLLIFGIYLAQVKFEKSFKLEIITMFNKFIIVPSIGFFVLKFFSLPVIFIKTIMLELLTPLAVTNVNISALFKTYPTKVAFLIILSSIIFFIILFVLTF